MDRWGTRPYIILHWKRFEMIIISACLIGINCRYDGGNSLNETILSSLSRDMYIPLCPEQLGGLSTPRLPSQIMTGSGREVLDGTSSIYDSSGKDVTEHFLRGAHEVARIARIMKIDRALMKEFSPSCGVCSIKRNGVAVPGMGVAASLLSSMGVTVISSEQLDGEYVRHHRNR